MKTTGKSQQPQFSSKFAIILSKFKDNSTIHVGHEQAKCIFGQYGLKDIFIPFISKMDNIEQSNDRERKEISKIYITFIEAYKTQILYDQYYQKLLESLNKKTIGVSDVIGHICKSLLNRIQDQEQLFPFVSIIINMFHNNTEVAKIMKQVSQTISPGIIASLQGEIFSIIQQKIGIAKVKSQFLDSVLSLVLCLQERLQIQSLVVNLLLKYLKHDDWSCRKNCVDIAYALLVINQQISDNVHNIIKELKYDKIKHVRDSVNNYQKLYQQIFGKQMIQKASIPQPSIRQAKIKSEYTQKKIHKSPVNVVKEPEPEREKTSSLDKSVKSKQKNENFFKNAKNSDVIKVSENSSTIQFKKEDKEDLKQFNNNLSVSLSYPYKESKENTIQNNGRDFEAYLKSRESPQVKQSSSTYQKPVKNIQKESQIKKVVSKFQSKKMAQTKQSKFNYESQFQQFKKKSKAVQIQPSKNDESKQNISFGDVEAIEKVPPQFSLSYISNKQENNNNSIIEEFKSMLFSFEKRINQRLDKLQKRIDDIEGISNNQTSNPQNFHINRVNSAQRLRMSELRIDQSSSHLRKDDSSSINKLNQSKFGAQQSPRSIFFSQTPNQSKYSQNSAVQSNLQEKVRLCIATENWDQAFTIALTNNKRNILLGLLQRCAFPRDKTVEECILLQVRKILGSLSTLKWLKYYLLDKNMSQDRMQKLRQDLIRRPQTDNRSYQMMKQLLINQLEERISS